jgi:hypothetical protein
MSEMSRFTRLLFAGLALGAVLASIPGAPPARADWKQKAFMIGGYHFTPDEVKSVVYLVTGSLIALLGAFIAAFFSPRTR